MYAEFLGSRKFIDWSYGLVVLLLASKEEREESGFNNLFHNPKQVVKLYKGCIQDFL